MMLNRIPSVNGVWGAAERISDKWLRASLYQALFLGAVIVLFLLAGSVFPACAGSPPQQLTVNGRIDKLDLLGVREPFATFHAQFQGSNSFIEVRFANGEIVQSGSDGRDSYVLMPQVAARRRDTNAMMFGSISKHPFPALGMTAAQLVWIEFALHIFSKSNMPQLPLECLPASRLDPRMLTLKTVRFHDNPHIFQKLTWFNTNSQISGTNTYPLLNYTKTYLAAELETLAVTNAFSGSFPMAFRLKSFSPHPFSDSIRDATDVKLVQSLDCVVTNVSNRVVLSHFLLALPSNCSASISDWRFKEQIHGGLHYTIATNQQEVENPGIVWLTTDHWPQEDDAFIKLVMPR